MKLIIIDGQSGAGKTTYANSISDNVIHMDDFFLPIELRTEERLSEAGGNIHYERFKEEVVDKLRAGEAITYRVFNCKEMAYTGETDIDVSRTVVIEGAYSMHPYFRWDELDIPKETVFMSLDPDEQASRIEKRNGKVVAEIFKEKWIPMENRYFEEFKIKEKCDKII